jgi:hypothetical protein
VAGFVSITTNHPMKTPQTSPASVSVARLAPSASTLLLALGIHIAGFAADASAAPGDLDPDFGTGGRVIHPWRVRPTGPASSFAAGCSRKSESRSATGRPCDTFTNIMMSARFPDPMPEPPDRDAWEDQREIFAFELLEMLENPACEVFFGDEAGFEGDPRPR